MKMDVIDYIIIMMKGKLKKEKNIYYLLDNKDNIIGSSLNNKLCIDNCLSIEFNYDLNKIIKNHNLEISNTSHSFGINDGIEYGFKKAIEILLKNIEFEQIKTWDVEILCHLDCQGSTSDKCSKMNECELCTNTGIPMLDENGCYILKRL